MIIIISDCPCTVLSSSQYHTEKNIEMESTGQFWFLSNHLSPNYKFKPKFLFEPESTVSIKQVIYTRKTFLQGLNVCTTNIFWKTLHITGLGFTLVLPQRSLQPGISIAANISKIWATMPWNSVVMFIIILWELGGGALHQKTYWF